MQIISSVRVATLKSDLRILDRAIKEQLKKYKLGNFINKDTNFAPMLYNLSRNYIHNSYDDSQKYDILVGAFKYVFLEKIGGNTAGALKNFTGEYNGNFISIEQYINTLMHNALINENKKRLQDATSVKNRKDVTPIEEETFDEALDRISNTPPPRKIKRFDPEHLAYLEGIKSDYTQLLLKLKKGKIKSNNITRSINRAQRKIDTLQDEIDELKSLSKENTIFLEMEEKVDDFTHDEEVLYEQLIAQLDKKAKRSLNEIEYNRIKTAIIMLIDGYEKQEIAKKLKLSPASMTWIMKELTRIIRDLAEEKEFFEDDPQLSNSLKKYSSELDTDVISMRGDLEAVDNELFNIYAMLNINL